MKALQWFMRMICIASLVSTAVGCSGGDEDPCKDETCSNHGTCSNTDGAAACACNDGYVGEQCEACASGYQDNDHNQSCEKDCPTSGLNCGSHGQCDDASGKAACVCNAGYSGALCGGCAAGYQDNDQNQVCLPNCATANLNCNTHGSCDDQSGTAKCVCETGYVGKACDVCDMGYQDNDLNGTCKPTCDTAALNCGANSQCDDSGGEALCKCDSGYQDNDNNNICLPDCATARPPCGTHGQCSDASGQAICACQTGYAGDRCSSCAEGYQDNDHNGTCVAGCATAGLTCGANQHCDEASGQALCKCDTGFQDNDSDNVCQPNCQNSGLDCRHGRCVDSTGTAECRCYTGYVSTGNTQNVFCDACDVSAGYQDNDNNGTCTPSCSHPQYTCSNLGTCDDQSGIAICNCTQGYVDDGLGRCVLPNGYDCVRAIPLSLEPNTTVEDSTDGAGDEYDGSCVADSGNDIVYRFQTTTAVRVRFDWTTDDYFYGAMYVRKSVCTDASPSAEVACWSSYAGSKAPMEVQLEADTTYFLIVDGAWSGISGSFTLKVLNPCPDEEAQCPGVPVCAPSSDWSSYICVCPEGMIPFNGECVDNPCDPNPCTQIENRTRCVTNPPDPPAFVCNCKPGYIPDPNDPNNPDSVCVQDPNGNEWTFAVYLNADNNLESYGFLNMEQMAAAGSTMYVNIVALWDSYEGPCQYVYVNNHDGNNPSGPQGPVVGTTVLEELGECDMGDWNTLAEFGRWVAQNYPARHYSFDMWDHGSGWDKNGEPTKPIFKGFSNDDHGAGGFISIAQGDYANALQEITEALGQRIDIIGFDACLMAMFEVAEASAPYAMMLLSSEETIPGNGWPYDQILLPLTDPNDPAYNPNMSRQDWATIMVDEYYNTDSGNSTLSAIDLDAMDALDTAITGFADALMAHTNLFSSINSVRSSTQAFYYEEYRDLKDFATKVRNMSNATSDIQAAADALIAQLGISIFYNRAQSDYPGAYGMSVYLPSQSSSMDPAYQSGAGAIWSVNTTWDEFLQAFTAKK